MDTTLAGIGTEKQFSNSQNEIDDSVPGISLTPDQESNQWNSFDPSTSEFTIGLDQTSTNPLRRPSRHIDADSMFHNDQPTVLATDSSSTRRSRLASFPGLDVLADAATSQTSSHKPAHRPHLKLSSAPQTKADQQKEALQKFSKAVVGAIQNAPSDEPADLENVIMRVLSIAMSKKENLSPRPTSRDASNQGLPSAQDPSDKIDIDTDTLTKNDALKATKAMSELIKKVPKAQPRLSLVSTNMQKCEHCPVVIARPCDMRKHMKRHTRPYGCTYPKCHKRFGAKSDWKRHENSQHFQLESFRCQLLSPSSQEPCAELFYRAKNFETHLAEDHKMTDSEKVDDEVKMRRIGKNGQGNFWCGFCKTIVPLTRKRNAAWDERFDHIDKHFTKEGKKIEQWLCVEAKKTKGEVLKDMDRFAFDDDDTDGLSPEDDHASPQVAQQESQELPAQGPMDSVGTTSKSQKRVAAEDPPTPPPTSKRTKQEILKYCVSLLDTSQTVENSS